MTRRGITLLLVALLGVSLLTYGLFEARKLIAGPAITLEYPENGSATSSIAVLIAGEAQNIAFLTINDAPAYTDEGGHFEELISPAPGVTVITVAAVDRFGRQAKKIISFNVLSYCTESYHGT